MSTPPSLRSPLRSPLPTPQGPPRPLALLDRDGVINVDINYLHRPADCRFTPGAAAAIGAARRAGYWVVVVTNQSGIARGYYDVADVHALHGWMDDRLRAADPDAALDAAFLCPHHPTKGLDAWRGPCACRKPGVGMLEAALAAPWARRPESFLIGDKASDMAAATAAGVPGYLYRDGALSDLVGNILRGATRTDG